MTATQTHAATWNDYERYKGFVERLFSHLSSQPDCPLDGVAGYVLDQIGDLSADPQQRPIALTALCMRILKEDRPSVESLAVSPWFLTELRHAYAPSLMTQALAVVPIEQREQLKNDISVVASAFSLPPTQRP
jgi:hypothetical protein